MENLKCAKMKEFEKSKATTIIIQYDAKCKHCSNLSYRANDKNKKQSWCNIHKEFTTLKTKACENFKL
jgi:hypothetical protein